MGFSGKGAGRARFGLGATAAMLAAARRSPERSQTPPPPGIGHNQGPPLAPTTWNAYCWRKAHKAAWKSPPVEVVRSRGRRAEALGLSYQEYTAHILDRGTHLSVILFTLLGTLIQRTLANIGPELGEGYRAMPGVAERLSGLKEFKILVMAGLAGNASDILAPQQASSIIEQLNRLCGNAVTKHEVCSDEFDAAAKARQPPANPVAQLLRRCGLSPAATLMIGSNENDRQCGETAKIGKYLEAARFFDWPASLSEQPNWSSPRK
jgi:hypothetical protein